MFIEAPEAGILLSDRQVKKASLLEKRVTMLLPARVCKAKISNVEVFDSRRHKAGMSERIVVPQVQERVSAWTQGHVVEMFKVTPQERVSERMGEEIMAERWKCGAQSRFDREEEDRCTLEVLVACNRPQECQ